MGAAFRRGRVGETGLDTRRRLGKGAASGRAAGAILPGLTRPFCARWILLFSAGQISYNDYAAEADESRRVAKGKRLARRPADKHVNEPDNRLICR